MAEDVRSSNKMCVIYTLIVSVLCLLPQFASGQYNNWDEYWQAWESSQFFPQMYPFSEQFHDTKVSDRGSPLGWDAEIGFHVDFFDRKYQGAIIAREGYIELSKDVHPQYRDLSLLTKWPNQNYPNQTDPPLVSPYFGGWDLIGGADGGAIYWRKLDAREHEDIDQKEIVNNLLEVMSADVAEHVVGGDRFRATAGLVVTWRLMPFAGCPANPVTTCPRSTVQTVLLVDESSTYVINNYYELNWVGSTTQLCSPFTGKQDESFPDCFPAQAGFNTGSGRYFGELPDSNTHNVLNLAQLSPTGVQGRHIYRVSKEKITRGGCDDIPEIEPHIWPDNGYMLGGQPVYVSGPCPKPELPIWCKFGEEEVKAKYIPDNPSKFICVQPMLKQRGRIPLCVSITGGADYARCTTYVVVPVHKNEPLALLENANGHWSMISPSDSDDLVVSWDPEHLREWHDTKRSAYSINVDIKLMGYTESENEERVLEGKWKELHTFRTSTPNDGYYSTKAWQHECSIDCDWGILPPVTVVQVSASGVEDPTRITSQLFYPGWFIDTAMTQKYDTQKWAKEICIEWHETQEDKDNDDDDDDWRQDIYPCPYKYEHAYSDIGHYKLDPDCDLDDPTMKCPKEYIHCVEAIKPETDRSHGSSSRCCYNQWGRLLFSGDTLDAGTAHKATPWGILPYLNPPYIPTLSHWVADKMPKHVCCNWTEEDWLCNEYFMNIRATSDINGYTPAKHSATFGDPHFHTFDGNKYTFNGRGEFWLVRVSKMSHESSYDNFNLQGRFEQPGGAMKATILTAVAMQEGRNNDVWMPIIEIRLNSDKPDKCLEVLVDGEVQDFGEEKMMAQEYNDLDRKRQIYITNNDLANDNKQSNFTVSFQSGVGVQVANKGGFLHVVLSAPPSYFELTQGLMGTWNDDPGDDLITPDGDRVDSDMDTEHIHKAFGEKWAVTEEHSRFTYRAGLNWAYYRDENFEPNFSSPPPPSNMTEDDIKAVCNDSSVCRFDLLTTMNEQVAISSQGMELWVDQVKEYSKPVVACSYLDVPNSKREVDHYMAGGEITITGCYEGYQLRGHNTYTCAEVEDSAEWEPELTALCKSDEEIAREKSVMAAAIAVPICLIIAVAVAATVGAIMYQRKKHQRGSQGGTYSENQDNIDYDIQSSGGPVTLTEDLFTVRPPRPESQSHTNATFVQNNGSLNSIPSITARVSMAPNGKQMYENPALAGSGALGISNGSITPLNRSQMSIEGVNLSYQPTNLAKTQSNQSINGSAFGKPPSLTGSRTSIPNGMSYQATNLAKTQSNQSINGSAFGKPPSLTGSRTSIQNGYQQPPQRPSRRSSASSGINVVMNQPPDTVVQNLHNENHRYDLPPGPPSNANSRHGSRAPSRASSTQRLDASNGAYARPNDIVSYDNAAQNQPPRYDEPPGPPSEVNSRQGSRPPSRASSVQRLNRSYDNSAMINDDGYTQLTTDGTVMTTVGFGKDTEV